MSDERDSDFPNFIVMDWEKPGTREKVSKILGLCLGTIRMKVAVIKGLRTVVILLDDRAKDQLTRYTNEFTIFTGMPVPPVD